MPTNEALFWSAVAEVEEDTPNTDYWPAYEKHQHRRPDYGSGPIRDPIRYLILAIIHHAHLDFQSPNPIVKASAQQFIEGPDYPVLAKWLGVTQELIDAARANPTHHHGAPQAPHSRPGRSKK
jgi:hypothetical protein